MIKWSTLYFSWLGFNPTSCALSNPSRAIGVGCFVQIGARFLYSRAQNPSRVSHQSLFLDWLCSLRVLRSQFLTVSSCLLLWWLFHHWQQSQRLSWSNWSKKMEPLWMSLLYSALRLLKEFLEIMFHI